MKHWRIMALMLALSMMTACSDDEAIDFETATFSFGGADTREVDQSQLIGRWRLLYSMGGLGGISRPKSQSYMTLRNNGTLEITENGETKSGSYSVKNIRKEWDVLPEAERTFTVVTLSIPVGEGVATHDYEVYMYTKKGILLLDGGVAACGPGSCYVRVK